MTGRPGRPANRPTGTPGSDPDAGLDVAAAQRRRRQLHRLLRAYPVPWRQQRGAELIGTVLDLTPDDRRLGWRLRADLVRGGWVTRLREHPPPLRWLAYRFGVRLPPRWQAWVRQDVLGRFFLVRLLPVTSAPPLVALWADIRFFHDRLWWIPFSTVTALNLVALRRARGSALRRHGLADDGQPATYRTGPR
jgi:Family of unknown function (DUF5313)